MRPRAARWFNSFDWRQMAASIALTAVLASGATQWLTTADNGSDSFAVAVANGHRRSLLAATPVDIVSSDRHTVKPWLDGRIGVSPAAPDMAKDGYALIGGRVEVIGDKPMPALVYRHHEHLITLASGRYGWRVSLPAMMSYWSELARDTVLPPANTPTVLVRAERTTPPYVTDTLINGLAQRLGANYRLLNFDCNHMVPYAKPDEVAALTRELLEAR